MTDTKEKRKKQFQEAQGYPSPDFSKLVQGHAEYSKEFSYTLNYTNFMFDPSEMKKHTEKWLNRSLKEFPDHAFVGIGQIAWILNNSGYVDPSMVERASQKVNNLKPKEEKIVVKISDTDAAQKSFQKRTDELHSELEGLIDDTFMGRNNLTTPLELIEKAGSVDIEKIYKHFSSVNAAIEDEFINAEDKKIIMQIVGKILTDIDEFTKPKKRASVRKKRKLSPDKIVKNLKYAKNNTELNLTSVNPEKIIETEVLWVYNQKNRTLGQYIAKNESGLTVKGSTILNFDETKSFQKTLRKPKEILKKLIESGKVTQRKILDDINAVAKPLNGRVNGDTLLIKVF